MALSPNYGWSEPDNSSLVKNGAQDIRALGDAIDTSVWNIGFGQAGKNKIINGDFGIWQRGTSLSLSGTTGILADRWFCYGVSGDSVSQQTFTPGTAPVAGYESQYFHRFVNGATASSRFLYTKIEDVRTFAGQTVTLSFWAKTASGTATVSSSIGNQNFGSGGSSFVAGSSQNNSVTTTWTRFTQTATVASVSGKTIGAGSNVEAGFSWGNTSVSIDIWGVQLEYGSKATPFETATGTIQGELAACQRYYIRTTGGSSAGNSMGFQSQATTTSIVDFMIAPQVSMRTYPTSVDYSNIGVYRYANGVNYTGGTITMYLNSNITNTIIARYTHGSAVFAINDGIAMNSAASVATYIGFSAEL